ncbi:ethanolamine ammonia-lyase reactivating factor EutA [Haladaptatus pallidirubidus]|uniref:Ethanolamine ammonia-lyase reactivating factor EutA n=1 Tax=Haladaptatus pallidirubidus TaxID=1008152 RepID=A0AAV3US93_9EURY|nr:ethanolamine ammonia-lyase reactivating factor EutA [Haladaptatus pallidirubidus]
MPNNPENLTSVGIDIGTTTTQLVVSHLEVASTGLGATTIEIHDRSLIHQSEIYETPLCGPKTIDVDSVVDIVNTELARAGLSPDEVDSGAVIITGETAYKDNAEEVVHTIAADAGDFVIATAGADLEAVLAGRGSGAAAFAANHDAIVSNVDIGGGTTNIAVFQGDSLVETRAIDVGGRLIEFDSDGAVDRLSPAAKLLCEAHSISITRGDSPSADTLRNLGDVAADVIIEVLSELPGDNLTNQLLIGDPSFDQREFDEVFFTGGIGKLITDSEGAPSQYTYHDFGEYLAEAIRKRVNSGSARASKEDIRATVIGAGTQTIEFSGTTVEVQTDLLPLHNLPVVAVNDLSTIESPSTLESSFEKSVQRGISLFEDADGLVLYLPAVGSLQFERIETIARVLTDVYKRMLKKKQPLIVVLQQNCAKALAQQISYYSPDIDLVIIDELSVENGNYIDIGRPVMQGQSVPVVIKTLVFEQ